MESSSDDDDNLSSLQIDMTEMQLSTNLQHQSNVAAAILQVVSIFFNNMLMTLPNT